MKAADLYPYWRLARRDLTTALGQLNKEQLEFSPKPGVMWSIGDVARHIIGAEAGWVNLVVLQKDEPWPQYPPERLPTVQSILDEMERVHAVTVDLLQEHDMQWLGETRKKWEQDFTLRWVFWHILDHEIHHRGEIFLMMGMQGLEVPDI